MMVQKADQYLDREIFKQSVISRLPHSVEWLSLGAMLFVAYIIFLYGDIVDTYDNSILFLKAIYHGKLFSFYSYTIGEVRAYWGANYESLIYVVYGLWNLPVLLISHLLGIDYFNWSIGLLWCKTLGIILTFATAKLIEKILTVSGTPKPYARLGAFLFLSSFALYIIAFVISQVDGFSLFMIMLGFYQYLKRRKWWFVLCFMIAMPTKMFALFLFLPLLLLREKRIPCIVGYTAIVFLLNLLSGRIFSGDPAYTFALGSQSRDAVLQILGSNVNMGQVYVPFILCYLGICVFCYLYSEGQQTDPNVENGIPIWCASAVWTSFVCFVDFNSYWTLYLLPFLIMAIVYAGRFLKLCTLLEMLFSVGYLGIVLSNCTPFADENLSRRLLLPHFMSIPEYGLTKYGSLNYMFEMLGGTKYAALYSTCMGGALLVILVLTCPFLFKKVPVFEKLERSVLWARIGCMGGFLVLLIYACTAAAPDTLYSTFPQSAQAASEGLLPGNTLEQEFVIQKNGTVREIELQFENPDYIRNNFCSLEFELVEVESGAIQAQERVGCALIEPDKRLTVKLGKVPVKMGEHYRLRIKGVPGIWTDSSRQIYPYVTDGQGEGMALYYNGKPQPYSLYMRVR